VAHGVQLACRPATQPGLTHMTAQTLQLTVPDGVVHAIAEHIAQLLHASSPAAAGGVGVGEPWLGVQQAAEHLACPVSRIYDLVSQGRLEAHHYGRRLLIRHPPLYSRRLASA
jgi:excisionase family DNA binding protein